MKAEIIDPIAGYKLDKSIKLHFCKPEYNMFKNGLVMISGKSFDKRKDAPIYQYMTSNYNSEELMFYFLGNHLAGNNNAIFNIKYDGTTNYKDYLRRVQSLSYIFFDELTTISYEIDSMAHLYLSIDNRPPPIVQFLLGGMLSLETVTLIHLYCKNLLEMDYSDYIWDQKKELIEKYSWFFIYQHIKNNKNNIEKQYKKVFQ